MTRSGGPGGRWGAGGENGGSKKWADVTFLRGAVFCQKNRALGFPPHEDGPFDPKNCRIPAPPFLEQIKREALFGGRKNCQKGPKTDLPLKFAFSGAPENPSRYFSGAAKTAK